MMDSSVDLSPQDPIGAQLDSEISSLQSQSKQQLPTLITCSNSPALVSKLKSIRAIQTRTLLTSHTSQTILKRLRASQSARLTPNLPSAPQDVSPFLQTASKHLAHSTENLYRVCASITTFRLQDPDPNAVDSGRVLGIRIDVSSAGRFGRPYYVMLNKPFAGEDLLRVHRHTVPPCIPLAALATRYLPSPRPEAGEKGRARQDLGRFVRALRRQIVAYQNRTAAIKGLRREFKLDEDKERGRKGKGREKVIVDISAADAEAKQVRIEWVDGRVGRCVVGENGSVEKCVVIGEQGRDWEIERRILGSEKGDSSMTGIGERLREGIY
jgi:central kinetochore subunit Mal2/MCM21